MTCQLTNVHFDTSRPRRNSSLLYLLPTNQKVGNLDDSGVNLLFLLTDIADPKHVVPNFPIPTTVLVHVSVDRVRALSVPNANGVQVLIQLEGIMPIFLSLQEKMRVHLLCTHTVDMESAIVNHSAVAPTVLQVKVNT